MPVEHLLLRKLGVKESGVLVVYDAPSGIGGLFDDATDGIQVRLRDPTRIAQAFNREVLLLFATNREQLEFAFLAIFRWMGAETSLWIAWPKKSSGVSSDLDFSVVQRIGLDHGLVDNKVCAIDATWSGLRHVVRKEHRSHWNPLHHLS